MAQTSWTRLRLDPTVVTAVGSIVGICAFAGAFQLLPLAPVVEDVRQWLEGFGGFGAVLFVAALAVCVVVVPLPERPLILGAGILFPQSIGVLLVVLGATLGAFIAFNVGRYLPTRRDGRGSLALRRDARFLGDWRSVVVIRLFFGISFDVYSYVLGRLPIRPSTFVWATAIGIMPGTIAEVYAGGFLLTDPWIAALIGVVVAGIGLAVAKIIAGRSALGTCPVDGSAAQPSPQGIDE